MQHFKNRKALFNNHSFTAWFQSNLEFIKRFAISVFFIFNNLHQVRSKPKDRKIVLQSIEPFENKLVNNVTCMVLYKINVAFVLIGSTRRPTHRIPGY
jgi:hypothetical protein